MLFPRFLFDTPQLPVHYRNVHLQFIVVVFLSDARSYYTVSDCSRPVPDLMCFLPAEKYLQCNPDIEEGQE